MSDKSKITKFSYANPKQNAPKKATRSGAESGANGGGQDGYERAIRKQKGGKGSRYYGSGAIRWHHYLQLILFLITVAWLMKSCGG
jgi:hypothetical protein